MIKLNVLVIDRTQSILDIMELILTGAGYRYLSSTKGYTPEEVAQLKPHLIVIEDRLQSAAPGRFISSRLKSSPLTASIPIIIMTTLVPAGNLLKEVMADVLLSKPFDVTDLETIVTGLLKLT